jgi:pimeloyl-ACP methyl ester carboxylesterase
MRISSTRSSSVPLSVFLSATFALGGCDEDVPPPDGGAPREIVWTACGSFDCATVDVPLDHGDLSLGETSIRVLRSRATAPGARRGVLLYNPGGPGEPAIADAESTLSFMRTAGLTRVYDVLIVDPRGVGESNALSCVSGEDLDALLDIDLRGAFTGDDAEWARLDAELSAWQTACHEHGASLLPHVGSDQVAGDLETLRVLLGEPTLDYVGVSYGTRIGAEYASRYPHGVGAFVFDSTVDPSVSALDAWFDAEASDYARELARFVEWCGASADCVFHGGEGATAVLAAYDALQAGLRAAEVREGTVRVREIHLQTAMQRGVAGGSAASLAELLRSAEEGDWALVMAAADRAFGRTSAGADTNLEIYLSVLAADVSCPAGFDEAAARDAARRLVERDPSSALVQATQLVAACLHPIVDTPALPTPHAADAPPILVLGGLHDPATPIHEAEAMIVALGNGSHLLRFEGEGHFYTPRSTCVAGAVLGFLADPTSTPAQTHCP